MTFEYAVHVPWAETTVAWRGEPSLLLRCPVCADEYQHHRLTRVFERAGGEDGLSLASRPGSSGSFMTDDNPSPRRDAVSIAFEGECGHHWRLNIVQHKGQTFVFAQQLPDALP